VTYTTAISNFKNKYTNPVSTRWTENFT